MRHHPLPAHSATTRLLAPVRGLSIVALAAAAVTLAPGRVSGIEAWRVVVRDVGRVESMQPGQASWAPIWRSRVLTDGDLARTQADSRARILLADQSEFAIGASSVVEMTKFQLTPEGRTVLFNLQVGKVRARVARAFGQRSRFEVTTPNGVLAARGTEFFVQQLPAAPVAAAGLLTASLGQLDLAEAGTPAPGNTFVKVLSGTVALQAQQGTTLLQAGQTALFGQGTGVLLNVLPPGSGGAAPVGNGESQSPGKQGQAPKDGTAPQGGGDADLLQPSGHDNLHITPPGGAPSTSGGVTSPYDQGLPPRGSTTTTSSPSTTPPIGPGSGSTQPVLPGSVQINIRTR